MLYFMRMDRRDKGSIPFWGGIVLRRRLTSRGPSHGGDLVTELTRLLQNRCRPV
jgi:hypothetical protein